MLNENTNLIFGTQAQCQLQSQNLRGMQEDGKYFYFIYIGVLLWVSGPLNLELQTVVSFHVGAGNGTQVLWKSSQCL